MRKMIALLAVFAVLLCAGCQQNVQQQETEPVQEKYYVPENSTYITAEGKEYQAGEWIPEKPASGDRLVTSAYTYMFDRHSDGKTGEFLVYGNGGWGVGVNDRNQTSYPELLSSINGQPLTSMQSTFEGCTKMTGAPQIPQGVVTLWACFQGCSALKEAPAIPDSVSNLFFAFIDCKSLELAPVIPEGVTDMQYTFYGCSSLKYAPVIPATVEKMNRTFYQCKSLVSAPVIPAGVQDLNSLFYGCESLKGEVCIDANLTAEYVSCGGTSFCCNQDKLECWDCDDCSAYFNCLKGTKLPIVLTGSCKLLHKIAATANNDNVTIQYS